MPLRRRIFAVIIQLGVLLLVVASCNSGAPGVGLESGDESQQLRMKLTRLLREEKTLAAESSLARNPAPYLLVDLPGGVIDLKALARTLREFKIADIKRTSPGGTGIDTWTLVDKRPLQMSERPKITPGAGEQGAAAAAQALWGPHRMPADYDLIFEGGKVLEIRALPSQQSGSGFVRAMTSVYRRVADWYRHWRQPEDIKPRYMVQIWLTENDSQALFWSLPKQLTALVVDPRQP